MTQLKFETSVGLEEKLSLKRPLNIKLGFDPTSPDLHLGHFVVLRGAKKLQDMGHIVHIIIGDFTASIGDPSGRNKLRPALTEQEITENAKTYMDQVFLILDKEKTKIHRNSSWLSKLNAADTVRLMSSVTLSQIIAREDFKQRFDTQTPIFMHELLYPLMQGLDSVAIDADVELGGTDQTFNLMMGRQLQKTKNKPEQAVLTFSLLVGLDGHQKMSKSLKNHIGLLDSPTDKFGKIMSCSDETMWLYWSVLMEKSDAEIMNLKSTIKNPKDAKLLLATSVVSLFHGPAQAQQECSDFISRFAKKDISFLELQVQEHPILTENIKLTQLLKDLSLASSLSDAGRKIEQNGVKVNQEKISDKNFTLTKGELVLLQVGKLNTKKVLLK